MTLELAGPTRCAGYLGPLQTQRHSDLADRFHFWRGGSGRLYACTRFLPGNTPAYENSVALFVRRRGADAEVLGVTAVAGCPVVPFGTEEVHLHIVRDGASAYLALKDLSALAPLTVERTERAAA
jgi:hypothetical protein